MHPSSFYDLQARYVYTSLHGPYSLSKALEGLISYSLDESRDSILIGSQRILHHALISEADPALPHTDFPKKKTERT